MINRILLKLIAIASLLFVGGCSSENNTNEPIDYVNPFIGTAVYGHTFPGAAQPFGMVQLSPATGAIRDKGYSYSSEPHGRESKTIIGFTHTNLSGTGIGHVAKYAQISLMPMAGTLQIEPGIEDEPEKGYRSRFSHDNEEAHMGYYKVLLDDYDITAELTSTERVGVHRYTFPETSNAHIVIDITREPEESELHKEAFIEVIDDNQVAGYTTLEFYSGKPLTWYFFAEFNKPFDSFGIFSGGDIIEDQRSAKGTDGIGAYIDYETEAEEQVIARVGISFTSIEGARKNLRGEVTSWSFDDIKRDAEENWNEKLNKIQVSAGTKQNKIKFYTALYHSLLFPRVFSDIDGAYYSHFEDRVIHENDFRYYVDFYLWDTYRTVHPLFTIIEPKRQTEMIRTFLTMYDQGGRIPSQVSYANFYTPIMIGDHAATTIIDSYMKGIRDFDVEKAYEAMLKNAFEPGPPDRSRAGLESYAEKGYVAAEKVRESVSKTLEDSHVDGILAQMSKDLDDMDNYQILKERANNYQNLYDETTGFYRPRFSDGSWLPECEGRSPEIVRHGNNTYYDCWNKWWIGVSPHRHYTESNAWQYLFYPQHDIQGLIDLMGGREKFTERLDGLFNASSSNEGPWYVGSTGAIGQYIQGNEPSHHQAFLYNYAGEPWKTQTRVRGIMETQYGIDAWGLPGNEDMGEMSAWFVFNAMGFYPVTPGTPVYQIGSPLFNKIEVNLGEYYDDKTFTVIANNVSGDNKYIQSARLNGQPLKRPRITHEEIVNGGRLEFEMGPSPNKSFWNSSLKEDPIANIKIK
ncbi:MAG: GH92 family glycosyl hydrolase [Bacteroidales bacterium]